MKKTFLYIWAVLLAVAAGTFLLPQQASAKYTVSDEAGLIDSQDNLDFIADSCEKIYQEFDTEVFILTRNSIPTNSRKQYLEDYADANAVEDAVMLLINMDSNNRGYEIQGYGSAEFAVSDSRIEDILDEMYGDMAAGNYTNAINTYVQEVYYACTSFDYQDYEENPDDYVPHGATNYNSGMYNPLMQLACSAGIALIIVILMVSSSGGKVTVNQSTYLDKSDSRLLARYDHYIRTSTSKRRKPSDSGGSGGRRGGGGVSSGGRSHSGGGRSF